MLGKLRFPWTGPYKFIRWVGERKCAIDKDGKEVTYNVNRLFKHHRWDEHHFDTSGLVSGAKPISKAAKPIARKDKVLDYIALPTSPPQVGETIIFVLPVEPGHRSPLEWGEFSQ